MENLQFKLNKEKSDERFEFSECEIKDWRITIIKALENPFPMCSVYVKREMYDEEWSRKWYIEIWNHVASDMEEAKEIAEKIYKTIYDYNLTTTWKEQ